MSNQWTLNLVSVTKCMCHGDRTFTKIECRVLPATSRAATEPGSPGTAPYNLREIPLSSKEYFQNVKHHGSFPGAAGPSRGAAGVQRVFHRSVSGSVGGGTRCGDLHTRSYTDEHLRTARISRSSQLYLGLPGSKHLSLTSPLKLPLNNT